MSMPKPYASLSSSLLARKGDARPAMRPQLYNAADDLGFNDMGDDGVSHVVDAPVLRRTADAIPFVVEQRVSLVEAFEATVVDVEPEPVIEAAPVAPPTALVVVEGGPAGRAVSGSKAKSAFTLRLDRERHLRLRLAAAHLHRSSQSVVVEALDAFLDGFDLRLASGR